MAKPSGLPRLRYSALGTRDSLSETAGGSTLIRIAGLLRTRRHCIERCAAASDHIVWQTSYILTVWVVGSVLGILEGFL